MRTATALAAPGLARLLAGWRTTGTSSRALAERIGVLLEDGRLTTGRRLPAENLPPVMPDNWQTAQR